MGLDAQRLYDRPMTGSDPDRLAELEDELAELRSDNARLRRLLDTRDAPGELRHRQRNSLAMLRMLVRASGEFEREREDYVRHLEDRFDAIARVQAAIDAFGRPELGSVIANELVAYTVNEGDHATLTGPTVRLEPHAAQVFALAIHELTVNAVEHGILGQADGMLDVRWQVADDLDDTPLTLTWKEAGLSGLVEPTRNGFGTEVLTETIAYELKAATTLVYEPDGLRCTIRFPLPDRIGEVMRDQPA